MMKKMMAFLLVGMLVLTGCSGNKNKKDVEDPTKNERVQEYAKQVSTDKETVDAVITGTYYKLPCDLKQFTDNGWKIDADDDRNKFADILELQPGEYTSLYLKMENEERGFPLALEINILNESDAVTKVTDSSQVVAVSGYDFYLKAEDFVSKGGFSIGSKITDVDTAFKDFQNYESDEYSGILSDRNEVEIVTYGFDRDTKVVKSVSLMAVDLDEYNEYVSPEQKEQEAARKAAEMAETRKEIEEESKKYLPDNYDGLVSNLKSQSGKTFKIYFEGEVTDYVSVTSDGALKYLTESAYIVTDSNGKQYSVSEGYSNKFNIGVGDKVKVWASTKEVLQMDDEGKVFIPYAKVEIIDINGTEAYN